MGRATLHTLRGMLSLKGSRLEVSEPFLVHATGRYMCIAKVVGRKDSGPVPYVSEPLSLPPPASDEELEPDQTQTLCVISEEGGTPEEARDHLIQRVQRIYKAKAHAPPARPRRGWLGRLIAVFASQRRSR